jgi:sirohydrochlorin ferrochelatase
VREIRQIIRRLRQKESKDIWGYAFLEKSRPAIAEGISRCVREGATEVILLLNFLNSGRHVDEDILRLVKGARGKYPSLRFRVTPPLGRHPKIADILLEMIRE